MGLREDKLAYATYILDVAHICGVDFTELNPDEILELSLEQLDSLSIEAEHLYNTHMSSKRLDRILDEIDRFGIDYVKEYYELNQKGEKNNDNNNI